MFHYALYESGSLYGLRYTFPKAGDGIPMHTHVEAQKHNVMCVKGRVAIYGPGQQWYFVLQEGQVMDLLDKHHPHEIEALTDGAVIYGMFIHGKPEGECLPADERSGTIHKPLTHKETATWKS